MGKIASLINVLPRRDFHDLSQSIYGTLTWGLLYPVYNRFFNAGDVVRIKPNFVIRTAPTVAPMFSPVEVRLHRFWCPLRLYHNAMRENSRRFDYTTAGRHLLPCKYSAPNVISPRTWTPGTLYDWLGYYPAFVNILSAEGSKPVNFLYAAEPLIAYWDIVRNYYGFSKNNVFSFMSTYPKGMDEMSQNFETLDILDDWVEAIYNSRVPVIIGDDPLSGRTPITFWNTDMGDTATGGLLRTVEYNLEGLAVAPSNPDGLSRFIPNLSSDVVTVNSPITIPSLAVAAKAQSVKDILSAAGTRFTDYLYAFFKTSIPHSDIPSLLYSGKFYLNSSPVMQTSSGTSSGIGGGQLGSFVGQNVGSAGLSSRRYKFDEPGYLMDILSIRPVYAWCGHIPYYNLDYEGSYMFNPRFNQLGFRSMLQREFGFLRGSVDSSSPEVFSDLCDVKTPFWNEFRSSVDEVHGAMRWIPGSTSPRTESYFVLQHSGFPVRKTADDLADFSHFMFCDMSTINNYFAVTDLGVDNTYMSAYYDVTSSSFVSKRFATDLTA